MIKLLQHLSPVPCGFVPLEHLMTFRKLLELKRW